MRGEAQIRLQQGPFPLEGTALIYLTSENSIKDDSSLKKWDTLTKGQIYRQIEKHQFKGAEHQMLTMESIAGYEVIILLGMGKKEKVELKNMREFVAEALKKLHQLKLKNAYIHIPEEFGTDFFEVGKHLSLALYLSNYRFDKYKSKADQKKAFEVDSITAVSAASLKPKMAQEFDKGVQYGALIARGTCLTRDLVNEPASALDPEGMVTQALRIEKASGGTIKVDVLDREQCKALGMGSYLAVAQGSDRPPKFIILRREAADGNKRKRLCLVGKSIIFDTGGYSLKPADFMMDMKIDMAGGATVLGIFEILSNWDEAMFGALDIDIYGILPVCENMISGHATRPGDIATAMNGKTIEILNTDAEGRLILADGLVYAEHTLKADYIIDLATLTGACMVALGKKIAGMFGDQVQLTSAIESVAMREGDELWQLPLYKPYLELMKSDIAELKNIGGGRYGGAITAAMFLKEFVTDAAWVHLDMAGPAYNDESAKGTVPKGGTGWGVLTLTELIRQWQDLVV